jgi:hypothetical protein
MMKKIILLLLLISATTLFAQTNKKEIFLDENNKVITETELRNRIVPPDYVFVYSKIETDTTIIKKLVRRKELGIISQENRLKIISALEEITTKKIDPDQTIIIHFFYEGNNNGSKTRTVKHYSSDKDYKKFLSKNPQIAQFFISENTFNYRSKNVFVDSNEEIEKMLFQYPFDSNYIIIKPNGHSFKHVGEYRQWDIPAILEADWGIESK